MPTVLVVDDEPLIRWSLAEELTRAGYLVLQAASGADVRQILATLPGAPLVVVLDLRLPDVQDLSLLQEIRAERPDAAIIMMSAHGTSIDAREAARQGAFQFVFKPFDVNEMVNLVGDAWTYTSRL